MAFFDAQGYLWHFIFRKKQKKFLKHCFRNNPSIQKLKKKRNNQKRIKRSNKKAITFILKLNVKVPVGQLAHMVDLASN